MQRNTFITFDSHAMISPSLTVSIVSRTQIPIRPHRLRIEPELAPFFMIEEIRVGTRSLFPQSQRVPASQFSVGLGDGLDAGDVYPGLDLIINVTNTSHLVPGGPLGPCSAHRDPACRIPICLRDERRLGVPLPFLAPWSAIVIVPRVSRLQRLDDAEPATSYHAPSESSGYENLGTRIDCVQETVGSPPAVRRELPGVGWDPYGQD